MTLLAAIVALLTGLAYTGLGVITAYELIRHRRTRGFSHFGGAFLIMALTCGPHHLVHAWRHLVAGEPAHAPMVAGLLLGLAPGLLFVSLRTEAVFGGRGDRLIAGTPLWLAVLPCAAAAALGATLWEAFRHTGDVDLRSLLPNVVLGVNYALVGLFTARTQLARRPVLGGWSLSGVAMSGVFITCGVSHLLAGLLTGAHVWNVALDNLGVPASMYFLWAVHRLHRSSLRDWNRQPLVGRSAPLGRRSPWAEPAA